MNMDTSYINVLIQWLGEHEGDLEGDMKYLKTPHIKPSLENVYYIFVALYAVVGLVGTVGCIAMIVAIIRRRLYSDPTFVFLLSIALSGLITAVCVLPLTLTVLIMKNWIFGSVICFIYPMLQAFPIYCTMISFVVLIAERYTRSWRRYKVTKSYAGLCVACFVVLLIWIVGVGIVVPFVFHMKYIDLGSALGKSLEGVGLCSVDTDFDHVRKVHLICLSLVFCFCPIITLFASLILRVKVQKKKARSGIQMCQYKNDTYGYEVDGRPAYYSSTYGRDFENEDDTPIDLPYELTLLKYINIMTILFSVCWFPLTLLTVSHQFDHRLEGAPVEGSSTSTDVTHLSLMLAGFFSSCTTPCLFGLWYRSYSKQNTTDSESENDETAC